MIPMRFTNPFAAAGDALQEALLQQEARKRQRFLDSLQLQDRELREQQMKQTGELQRAQLEALEEARQAQAELRRAQVAG